MIMICVGFVSLQRSRGHDVHWPMTLSLRIAPGPTTRASGLRRQRSPGAALKRNLKKAKKGWGPLAVATPGATGNASEELALLPQRRRLLANCPGKIPAAPTALGKLGRRLPAVAPAGLGKLRRRLPAALGRRRPGGARRVGRTGRMSERWRCGRATGSEHHGVMHCCRQRKMKNDTCTPVSIHINMHGSCECLQTSVVGHGQYRHTRNTTLNDTKRHMSDTCPKTSRPEATQKIHYSEKLPNGTGSSLLKQASMSLRLKLHGRLQVAPPPNPLGPPHLPWRGNHEGLALTRQAVSTTTAAVDACMC